MQAWSVLVCMHLREFCFILGPLNTDWLFPISCIVYKKEKKYLLQVTNN